MSAVVALGLAGAGLGALGFRANRENGEEVDGEAVYARRCAFCHDAEGSIGAEITASTLAVRGDEEGLARYLRLAMPYEAPGTLTDAEYRATARYLFETRGPVGATRGGPATGEGR